ncbi:MAG: hypothetical protein AAFO06_24890 [Cyanobacteria bacterium J06597_16]
MSSIDLKTQITHKLNQLPPSLLSIVNDFINKLTTERDIEPSSLRPPGHSSDLKDNSDTEDSIVGMIDGHPDLASNAESILREEIQPESGWSWRQ